MPRTPDPLTEPDGALEGAVRRWQASLRRRALSEGTIQTYTWGLSSLIEHCAACYVFDLEDLHAGVLEGWQDQLVGRALAPKTRSIAATAVRQFLCWAADQELIDWRLTRKVAVVRTRAGRPRPIPLPDLVRIQAHIAPLRPDATEKELRDRALFTFLLVSGARISEALQVTRDQVLAERPIVVRQKGGSEKELFVTPTVRERVMDYLRRRVDASGYLWVTANLGLRRLLTREMIGRVWRQLAREVGVPRWTSHQLRHTCATELKRAGVADLVIAQHLGHHNLSTLANYAAVVDEHHKQKLEVLEGLLKRGSDAAAPSAVGFHRPAAIRRSRVDNRIRRRETG